MASVGSLTSSTSNSIRGYGGLASGLDRDELIEGMTIGTRTKINQQEQKKQKIEWMQEAVRTISDKMISFHGKYTETLTSPSNLFSAALWGRNKITTSGENSKYVSISGSASSADAMTILGVKQKAQNASWSSANTVSDGKLSGKEFITTDTYNSAVEGTELHFKVGDGLYNIKLTAQAGDNLDSVEKIKDAINAALEAEPYKQDPENKHLSDFIEAEVTDGKLLLKAKDPTASEDIKLLDGSAMHYLGLDGQEESDLKSGGVSGTLEDVNLSFEQRVLGKTLTFSYNGTEAQIKLPTQAELDEALNAGNTSANKYIAIKDFIQNQLNSAFGTGRISVKFNNESDPTKGFSFTTLVPGEKEADGTDKVDKSATLTLVGGEDSAISALGLKKNESTRLNINAAINESGLSKKITFDTNGKALIKINNKEIEFSENDTIKSLMSKITEKTGLQVSYMEASDKFTFTSNEKGASGAISIDAASQDIVNNIFGLGIGSKDAKGETIGLEKRGQDAIVAVKYAGSDQIVELRRDSNTFTVDGLTLSLKGTFGYDKDGELENVDDLTKAVEVNAEVDVDKLMSTIKSFVEDYNAIVDMVNGELTTKHDNDYDPLSSEQKSELSESEIEKWEAKAKAGLLYGDSDLRNLSMDLRTVATSYVWQLEEVGISLSSNYSDNGKMSIDETKLRAALTTNPEKVEKLFTATAGGVDADGKPIYNGVATNLKNVMNKYVKTTGPMEEKGILIRKAGSQSAAMSLTENYYYDQITSIEKLLDTLNDRLKTEQDRYISQFSSLETLINNMNSQSSYLSSMF